MPRNQDCRLLAGIRRKLVGRAAVVVGALALIARGAPLFAQTPAILEGIELPAVKPTAPPPPDRIAEEFKAARMAYETGRSRARADLTAEILKQRAKIASGELVVAAPATKKEEPKKSTAKSKKGPARKGAPPKDIGAELAKGLEKGLFPYGKPSGPPAERAIDPKVQSLQQFDEENKKFALSGVLPSHPAMKDALAAYKKALEANEVVYKAAIEKALAAYSAAGVKDLAKLKPITGQQAMLRHANLVGVWQEPRQASWYRIWIIGVDPTTGDWQADGIDSGADGGLVVIHGEKVNVSGTSVSFVGIELDRKTGEPAKKGAPRTLQLQSGKLRAGDAASKTKAVTLLDRTDADDARKLVAFNLKKGGIGERKGDGSGRYAAPEKVDLADANAVWRELAALSSFAYYHSDGSGPFWGERLYMPYRSTHMTVSPGQFGFLGDAMRGRSSGAGVIQGQTDELMRQFDHLAEAPHPYLKRAAERAQTLSRARCQLALADDEYGNTASSQLRVAMQTIALPGLSYAFQRDADRIKLQEELQQDNPNYRVVAYDAPMSDESLEALESAISGALEFQGDLEQRAAVSGLLAYADMEQVDRLSQYWQTMLLPLAQRCGGPAAAKQLVNVEGVWWDGPAKPMKDGFKRLNCFQIKNVSGHDLTHAVLEVVSENQWGTKASHYVYLPRLEAGEYILLVPHPRWKKRKLDFSYRMTVTVSTWADQGTSVGQRIELRSPSPDPRPAAARRDYLAYDRKYQAQGEALGAVMRGLNLLPVNPARQKRLLMSAAAPGSSYVFRLPNGEKSERALVMRFSRVSPDGSAVEAEVFDAKTKQPLKPEAPIWRGAVVPARDAGYVIRFDSKWIFEIASDDLPVIVPVATEGTTTPRSVPLLSVKS